jgi:MFS family permease
VVAFEATRDALPIYAVYALLFRDHGLSPADITTLLLVWSVTSFLLEVPSGAWADAVDRRRLLVASAVVHTAAFTMWMVWPAYPGFLAGFVLWGLAGAMASGTFEALLYDELSAAGAPEEYARVRGLSYAATGLAELAAMGLAGVLFALGGYGLTGWTSVAICGVHVAAGLLLPAARPVERADETGAETGVGGAQAGRQPLARRYLAMLRDGLGEAAREPRVRRALLVVAPMLGLVAYDEYLTLAAREGGFATADVPWVVALVVAGQVAGTALAGRAARAPARRLAGGYAAGALLVAGGVVLDGWWGWLAVAAGYGLTCLVLVVAEARLQEVIESAARATVLSAFGLATEVFTLLTYAAVGLATLESTLGLSVTAAIAALGLPLLLTALASARWLPDAASR